MNASLWINLAENWNNWKEIFNNLQCRILKKNCKLVEVPILCHSYPNKHDFFK